MSGPGFIPEFCDPLRERTDFEDASSVDSLAWVKLVINGKISFGSFRLEVFRQVTDVELLVLEMFFLIQ